jgi:glycosyltransferase involved in cell wall biosynthesis
MAAYNAEQTIRGAVDSVLGGTLAGDLYIVDDCSRIPVSDVIAPRDGIEIIRLAQNGGPARARNAGLERILARGYRYVAIMDADDLCYPDRLAKQIAYLDAHPKVGVLGSWARFVTESGEPVLYFRPPTDPDTLRRVLFLNSNVSHSTCVFRTEALRRVGVFSDRYPAAEDYELVRRIATRFDIANLPEFLLDYRISPGGISVRRRRRQLFDRLRIQLKYFRPLQWRAWVGIGKTMLLFILPAALVTQIKSGRLWRWPARLLAAVRR